MSDSLGCCLPEGVNPFDKQAALRAAIECIDAANLTLEAAKVPHGALTEVNILRCLYDLDRAYINANLYHATGGTAIFGVTPYRRACELVERIRAEIAQAVASFRANPNAPSDGWSNHWDLYDEYCGGADVLWDTYRCVGGEKPGGDEVVDWIQTRIRVGALDSPWHFGAWPTVCERLQRFSQQALSDLGRALLHMPEPATDEATQRSEPEVVPPMWEGRWPSFPIKTLADVHRWLDSTTDMLPVMRDFPLAFKKGEGLDLARQILRNTRRLLYQLGTSDFSRHSDSALDTIHNAEGSIAELRAWIKKNAVTSSASEEIPVGTERDGPQPPYKFLWRGKQAEMQPIPWKLVDFLWKAEGRTAKIETINDAVWGHDSNSSDSSLKSAISRANNALMEKGIPISLSQKAGGVLLTISVT